MCNLELIYMFKYTYSKFNSDSCLSTTYSNLCMFQCDFNIEYLPLRVEETSVKLVLNSTELGSYTYDLVLRSLPPRPEKPLFFRAPLGSQQTLTATFLNYSKAKCEYTIKVS